MVAFTGTLRKWTSMVCPLLSWLTRRGSSRRSAKLCLTPKSVGVMVMIGHRGNILDPVHDTLDSRVWLNPASSNPVLKERHATWVTDLIFSQATAFHHQPAQWLKLIFTGSLTTYQYSDDSDVDISLFVSPQMLPEWDRARLIGLMIDHVDGKRMPNTPFTMQAFVVPKNISSYDLFQPGLRSGYDIESDNWLVAPEKERIHNVEQDQNADYVYALETADKM